MPKRRPIKRRLTLVEIVILLAIGGILLSIIIPAISKQQGSRPRREQVVRAYGETGAGQPSSSGLGIFLFGVGLGIAGTLLYQRGRKSASKKDNSEVGGSNLN
jgi:hypothetical protein